MNADKRRSERYGSGWGQAVTSAFICGPKKVTGAYRTGGARFPHAMMVPMLLAEACTLT
jgi:hypothetical protein